MANDEWRTPPGFYHFASAMWGPYDLDVAATPENSMCPRFYTEADNAVSVDIPWDGRVWCNPPYSRIMPWVEKALWEVYSKRRCPHVTMLLPPNVDTEWFHLGAHRATTYLLRGRIRFMDPTGRKRMAPRDGNIVMTFPGIGQIQTLDWMSYRIIHPAIRNPRRFQYQVQATGTPAAGQPASPERPVPAPSESASTPRRSSGSPRTPRQD